WNRLSKADGEIGDVWSFIWNYRLARLTESPTYYWHRLIGSTSVDSETFAEASLSMQSSLSAGICTPQLLSLKQRIERRKTIVGLYHSSPYRPDEIELPQYSEGRYLCRILALLPENLSAARVRTQLRSRGIKSRLGYPLWSQASTSLARSIA